MSKNLMMNENLLREMFDKNFERLRLENGHSLAPAVREMAWEQVRAYWLKLRHIAESVSDTEVRLNLPNQVTAKKRVFCIEGVVDIVREGKKTTMYDLKTHDLDVVEENIELYKNQLNVYAHIWRSLRGEQLDETAVISTPVPDNVREAIRSGDSAKVADAFAGWNPVIPIIFDAVDVEKTIGDFACVVDKIENKEFSPPNVAKLKKSEGKRGTFASRVCRNCDVRFSCASYREYAKKNKDRSWTKFADFYDFAEDEAEAFDRFVATPEGEE